MPKEEYILQQVETLKVQKIIVDGILQEDLCLSAIMNKEKKSVNMKKGIDESEIISIFDKFLTVGSTCCQMECGVKPTLFEHNFKMKNKKSIDKYWK